MMNKRTLIRKLDQLIGNDCLSRSELKLLGEIRDVLERKPQIAKPGPRGPIPLGQQPRVDRNLQTAEARIVAHIEAYPDHCFAFSDLLADMGLSEHHLKTCLTRLVRDGFIARPRRGFYSSIDI